MSKKKIPFQTIKAFGKTHQIRACPFCGTVEDTALVFQSTLNHYQSDDGMPKDDDYYVAGHSIFCSCCGFHMDDEYADDLVKRWNRRAKDEKQVIPCYEDGRPCSTDVFMDVLMNDKELDDHEFFAACKDWLEGDWDGAIRYISDATKMKLLERARAEALDRKNDS